VCDVRDGYITVARLKGSLRTVQLLMKHADELLDEKAGLTAWIVGKAAKCTVVPDHAAALWAHHAHSLLWPRLRQQPSSERSSSIKGEQVSGSST
jgi:hypothetical protein